MKLRIQNDSVRLRLTRREVAALVAEGRVECAVHFPGGARFTYALRTSPDAEIDGALSGNSLTVTIPAAEASDWADTDRIAIECRRDLGDGAELRLLIEKDFQCMHKDDTSEDAYPNPAAAAR